MDWQILKDKIYNRDGSYRDIYVHNTTKEDWQIWADFVNKNYKTSFHIYDTEVKKDKVDLTKIFDYWNGTQENCSSATVFIDNIQVNAHFFIAEEIENDITPNEINSMDDHNNLMNYMINLSKVLNKTVVLTPENEADLVLISVDKDEIKINLS
ncbi:hypothetical protein [Ferruginibacter profundus]